MRPLRELARTADGTPPSRDRYVDMLRVVAIALVVIGHWLVTAITYTGHRRPSGHSALDSLTWAYPLTWLFQVVPVFIVVGGYSNAASLAAFRRRGGDAVGWLEERAVRLVRPTTVLLLVLAGGAVVARLAGADAALVRAAVWTASIPLWFLAAYLVLVLVAPVMHRLHERFGAAVPVVLVVAVGLGDVARFTGAPALADGGFLFGWLAIHQIGFFWRDGRLRFARPVWSALLAGSVVALVLLTVVGPYPVTMIDVTGERIKNASPPSVALLATAAAQISLIMLLLPSAERWLRRRWPWRVVLGGNAVVLTVFLWHMSAVLILVGVLWWVGELPTPRVGTADWWLWRVPWLLLLAVVLALLVAVFGAVEVRRPRAVRRQEPPRHRVPGRLRPPLAVAGFAATAAGLLINNVTSSTHVEPLGVPVSALAIFLSGALLLRFLRSVG